MTFLYTMGYEGVSVKEFVSKLMSNNIDIVIDVRQYPHSRKKGFSKSQLQAILESGNITYIHLGALGSPPEIRKQLRESGDYDNFFEQYSIYLRSQIEYIDRINELLEDKNCCLLCLERNPEQCHRKLISAEVKKRNSNGLRVVHI